MKKDHETRLHYDLRLEWNGKLPSWSFPEGPSRGAGAIRKAIEMKDHNRANPGVRGRAMREVPSTFWERGTVGAVPGNPTISRTLCERAYCHL